MKDWSDAKERLSVEITRKIENGTEATRFEKARGYTRSNWSSKNFHPSTNPLEEDTSSSEEDEEIATVL